MTTNTPMSVSDHEALVAKTNASLSDLTNRRDAAADREAVLDDEIAVALAEGANDSALVRERDSLRVADLARTIAKLEAQRAVQEAALAEARALARAVELDARGKQLGKDAQALSKKFRELYAFLAECVGEIAAHNTEVRAIHEEAPNAFQRDCYLYLERDVTALYSQACRAAGQDERRAPSLDLRVPLN